MRKGLDYPGIAVVYICHDGKGNFLFNKRGENCRDEKGKWDCGGGSIDLHMSVEDTLHKEIKEEFCADVLNFEFMGYRSVHREHEGEKTHWVTVDFKVLVDPTQVKNGEPHKFDDIGWFSLDKVPSPVHSEVPGFLEKYKEHF